MRIRSPQPFVVHFLPDGGFDQVGTRQKDATIALNNEGFVGHDGQVGTARNTRAHNGRDLDNPHGGHAGIVTENPTKMLFVRKDLVLHRQVDSGAVHQVNNGQAVFHGNFLGSQVFFAGDGEPGPRFDGRVVGHHHAKSVLDSSQDHHHTAGRAAPFLFVLTPTGQGSDLEARASGIQQGIHPFTCAHFAFGMQLGQGLGASTGSRYLFHATEVVK